MHLSPFTYHDLDSAPAASRPAMQANLQRFGMLPNLTAVMAVSPGLVQAYLELGDRFRETDLNPVEQQVVLLTVSRANGCDYCVSAHSLLAEGDRVAPQVVRAIREDDEISDSRLASLRRFTEQMVVSRGWVSDAELNGFLEAGFQSRHVLDVILGVGYKTLSNYTNHMASTRLDDAFAQHAWSSPGPRPTDPRDPHHRPWDRNRFPPQPADGRALEGVRRKFGLVPNLAAVMAGSSALIDGLMQARSTYGNSTLDPTLQELAVLTASRANQCHYCVALHSAVSDQTGIDPQRTDAVRQDLPLPEPGPEALRLFTQELQERRGWVRPATVKRFLEAGFDHGQMLDLVLASGLMVMSNYTAHVSGVALDEAFASRHWEAATPGEVA